jgi:predicted transcriptional regulator
LVNYRRKLDIVADILNVAIRNPKKTQIMYQANLSYSILQKYLADMSDASLICFEDETRCYRLTVRGREFLKAYKEYSRTNKRVEKVVHAVKLKKETLERLFNQ